MSILIDMSIMMRILIVMITSIIMICITNNTHNNKYLLLSVLTYHT